MTRLRQALLICGMALWAGCGQRGESPTAASKDEAPAVITAALEQTAATDSDERVKSITFDHLKFEMETGAKFNQRMLTDQIRGLFDKNVRIRGYLLPSFKQDGLTNFALCRDTRWECCFGPGAPPYNAVVVDMVEGKSTNYTTGAVTVEGTLSFQKYYDPQDGELRCIYHMDAVRVR